MDDATFLETHPPKKKSLRKKKKKVASQKKSSSGGVHVHVNVVTAHGDGPSKKAPNSADQALDRMKGFSL